MTASGEFSNSIKPSAFQSSFALAAFKLSVAFGANRLTLPIERPFVASATQGIATDIAPTLLEAGHYRDE
jgi:hypothetical protein